MGKPYPEITDEFKKFIENQHVFFVATATADSKINLSPKGLDTLRILDKNRVLWLNLTGAGNETSIHSQLDGRMTIMFCSFEPKPMMILRLYGHVKAIHRKDKEWNKLLPLFDFKAGARQIFDFNVELVTRSCGFGVPLYDFVSDREKIKTWSEAKSEEDVVDYWKQNCQTSLDGVPTKILELNT